MPHLHVITTGGTIDKVYDAGQLVVGDPVFESLLSPVRTDLTYDVTSPLAIDSLDMTDEHRAQIVSAVDAVPGARVLITHGTDTMAQTASYLQNHLQDKAKVVVLTGAMRPASMRSSDASFNLGAAVVAAQLLSPGIHIAMSGRVFHAGAVIKDTARGIFVEG